MWRFTRIFSILLTLIILNGCWIPEQFDAHINFNKDGSYTFYYEGILTHGFVAEVFYKERMPVKDEANFKKEVIDDLISKPEFKEVSYLGKGKFKVKVIKNGTIDEAYYFPLHESETKIFAILPQKDGSISVKAFLPDKKTIHDLMEMGVKIDGTLEISVASGLNVIKHNAQTTPFLFGLFGEYKWHIKSLDEEPFIDIQQFHSSSSDALKPYNETGKSIRNTSPSTIASNLLNEAVQSFKKFFILMDFCIKKLKESLFNSSEHHDDYSSTQKPEIVVQQSSVSLGHDQQSIQTPVIPIHKQGDTYISQTINIEDGSIVNTTERKISIADSDRIIIASHNLKNKSGEVRKLEFTPDWNLMAIHNSDGGGLNYSPPLKYYEFPLTSGKTWRQSSLETDIKTGVIKEHILSALVGDWEDVTVPAGNFRGIKVTIQTELIDRSTGKKSTGTDTSWYVPEVRKSVRSLTSSRSPEGVESRQDSQLISYNLIDLSESGPTVNQITNTPRSAQIQTDNAVAVPYPVLPEAITAFIANHGLKIPVSISKYCQFDFKTNGSPYFVSGDFDGDNRLDYAIDVEEKNQIKKLFVFLGSEQTYELTGWDYIYTDKRRGEIKTYEGSTNLQYDSIGGVKCESSSVVYVYDKIKNGFNQYFTSD